MASFTDTVTDTINNFFYHKEKKRKVKIRVSEIQDALQKLNITESFSDIVRNNKADIKKAVREMCLDNIEEIKKNSFAVVNINDYKVVSTYFNLDNQAFMRIAYTAAQQEGLELEYSYEFVDEDDEESEKENYLIIKVDQNLIRDYVPPKTRMQ